MKEEIELLNKRIIELESALSEEIKARSEAEERAKGLESTIEAAGIITGKDAKKFIEQHEKAIHKASNISVPDISDLIKLKTIQTTDPKQ